MNKKTIAAILIGVMVTSSFTGCGTTSADNTSTTQSSPSEYTDTDHPGVPINAEYPEAEYPEAEYPEAEYPETETEPAQYTDTYSADAAYETSDMYDACTEESCAGSYETEEYCTDTYAAKGACYEEYCYPDHYYGNNEKYKSTVENAFTNAATTPLATFGADIDTASYANLRRMINDNYDINDIPAGSIRTEELVNYFNYNYREPGLKDTFAVNASIIDCPWNKETKLVNLGIKARNIEDIDDVASNIVFLIDTSGSMESYDKLPLLQMGLDTLIDDLDENDRVSIVTYASSSDVVIAGVPGNEHTKIKRAINDLSASGSTNGSDGIMTAYRLAEKYFIKDGNNRVIMATDGDLNVGITSEEELEDLISDKKEGGVFLSVLGFGTDNYNEVTLETLADKGNGNYSYIDCLTEAKKVLVDEFGSTLFTVAKDVKFQTEFNPKYVSEYRLIGYENRQMASKDFDDDSKDGGEIGSGHSMTIMYEIKLNEDNETENSHLKYQNTDLSEEGLLSDEWMTVSVRYKETEEDNSKLVCYPVSKACYTNEPDCDTLFAAYVAECGMILNNSEYIGRLSMADVADQVSELELNDEYKEEFLDMIRQL